MKERAAQRSDTLASQLGAAQLIVLSYTFCAVTQADGDKKCLKKLKQTDEGKKKYESWNKLENVQIDPKDKKLITGSDDGPFCVLSRFPECLSHRV